MKIAFRIIAAIMMIIMLLPISSFAAERIDIDSNCSLTISYVDEKTPIKNAKIKAYRVMDVYENGEGDLTEAYKQFEPYLNTDPVEWEQLAGTLEGYILMGGLKDTADASGKTGSDGKLVFSGLKTGVYLVVAENVKSGKHTYEGKTFLIMLPGTDSENNSRVYDVSAIMKFDKRKESSSGQGKTVFQMKCFRRA